MLRIIGVTVFENVIAGNFCFVQVNFTKKFTNTRVVSLKAQTQQPLIETKANAGFCSERNRGVA